MFEVGRDSRELNIISKSDAHQEDPSSNNFSMRPDDLDSLSLGTTLQIKPGYSANYEQWVKTFKSCQKSHLLLDSTGYQCKKNFETKNEESDTCQNDSGCEHGQLQTCCSGNKCTQENICKLLNIKTFSSVDGVRKKGDEDNWSEKLTVNTPENRIHKSSGFRQDISDQSISLSGYNKQVNKTDQLEAIKTTELQCEEPRTIMATQQNPLLLKQSEQHKHVYDQGRDLCCMVYEVEKSALKTLKPADVESVSHQNEVTSCCRTASELIYNTTYSHFKELYPDQLKSESTQSTISKHGAQDNLDVTDDITFKAWPYLNYNCAKQVKQMNAYVSSSGDSSKPDNITSECYKNKEKITCNGNSSSNKGNDAEIFYSGKHLALLTYNLSAAVIVLALTVMYLYVRITSLEASRDVFIAQCPCGEMCLSKTNGKYHPCLDCGKKFAQVSSLSRHRGRIHGMKKHHCQLCGRTYTSITTLSSHMKSHHPQTMQPEVIHKTSLDESLVIQKEQTPSSDTPHIHYEYSTSIPCTTVSTSPQLTSHDSTSSWLDPAHSASSSTTRKRLGSSFLHEPAKIPKVEYESLSTDPYIIQLELYISYFKDSMICYSSLETYKMATKQHVDLDQQNRASQM